MCDDHAHGHDHRPAGSAAPLPLNRRSLLAGAGGALLLAGVPGTRAMALDTATGASRGSRLTKGTRLVHADLHNHTLLSDGDGNPTWRSRRCARPDSTSRRSPTTPP